MFIMGHELKHQQGAYCFVFSKHGAFWHVFCCMLTTRTVMQNQIRTWKRERIIICYCPQGYGENVTIIVNFLPIGYLVGHNEKLHLIVILIVIDLHSICSVFICRKEPFKICVLCYIQTTRIVYGHIQITTDYKLCVMCYVVQMHLQESACS